MRDNIKVTRWIAAIAGLIGFVLSVATPLLPVVQTTATLNWPQNGQLNNVTAPLISQAPVSLTATVPCSVIEGMPADGADLTGPGDDDGHGAVRGGPLDAAERGRGARHRTEERQAGHAERVVRQRHRPAR